MVVATGQSQAQLCYLFNEDEVLHRGTGDLCCLGMGNDS